MSKKQSSEYPIDLSRTGQQLDAAEADNGKPRQKAPSLTPRERFYKHAERRVAKACKSLLHVERMGNGKVYESTEDERDRIIAALESSFRRCVSALRGEKTAKETFKLF